MGFEPSPSNQVCTQRWRRLENVLQKMLFSRFPVEISILVHLKQISVVSKSDKQKKKKKKEKEKKRKEKEKEKRKKKRKKKSPLLIFIPFPLQFKFFSFPFTVSLLFRFISLFFLASLFPFLLFLPLPSLFTPFSLPSKIFPKTFKGWATPSYSTGH